MSDADHKLLVVYAKKCLFTTRGEGFQKKARAGYLGRKNTVHHILPCAALKKSKDDFLKGQKAAGVKLAIESTTHYTVNEEPNLIGLPTRLMYIAKFGTRFAIVPRRIKIPKIDPLMEACSWPVHYWEHAKYSKEAKTRADSVWSELSLKIAEHKPVEANDIRDAIVNVSKSLKSSYINNSPATRTKAAWQAGNKKAFDLFR